MLSKLARKPGAGLLRVQPGYFYQRISRMRRCVAANSIRTGELRRDRPEVKETPLPSNSHQAWKMDSKVEGTATPSNPLWVCICWSTGPKYATKLLCIPARNGTFPACSQAIALLSPPQSTPLRLFHVTSTVGSLFGRILSGVLPSVSVRCRSAIISYMDSLLIIVSFAAG